MSQPQAISYADLTIINNALRSITHDMTRVNGELAHIHTKQDVLEGDLSKLADAFASFVEADSKHKALQLAETRVGNLRQELQINFGYYAEVRRMATGILQGVDTGVISDDTLRFTTEEVMIKAPGYWLAPALVALASWIREDKNSMEKALREALKRDDYKTSLFFMLIMRRLARTDASLKWLERYFMHQNPHHLDREFVVILEAVTTGVFPPAARQLMMFCVKSWLDQLTQGDTFINEQKTQWVGFFEAAGPTHENQYTLLAKYAVNWQALERTIREARSHGVLQEHFKKIFSSSSNFSKSIKVQLDEILSLLVVNFDDEELPLQQQVRLNQLIIEQDGDKIAAQRIMDAEKNIFYEKVDFLQMLTNASFNPELSGATRVTQALAVSISQPWMLEAYDTFAAQTRSRVPVNIDLNIDNCHMVSSDGKNETALLKQQEDFYRQIYEAELKKVPFPWGGILIGALVVLLGFWAFSLHWIAGLAGLGIGLVLAWNNYQKYKAAKTLIFDKVEERKRHAREVLRGCMAEIVDYRAEFLVEDAKAEPLRDLLASITPEDFSSVSKEAARNLV